MTQHTDQGTILYVHHAPGSSVTITTDIEITAQEFDEISKKDYKEFDYNVPQSAMANVKNDPSAAGAEAMGQFRFGAGATFGVSCTAVLNGGEILDM